MNTRKMSGVGITLLLCAAPQLTAAVSGCNNGYLLGNYNAEVTNLNLQASLQALNGGGGTSTQSGGGGGSTSGTSGTAGSSGSTVIGFSNNPKSLSGAVAGASRFYFDGAGTIVGASTPTGGNVPLPTQVGTYTVNTDCTAAITLSGGATFDAVVADSGRQVLFVETDSTNAGAAGLLQRASSCVNLSYPQSFAFSFFGVAPNSSSTSGTTGSSGGTTGSTGGTTGGTGGTGGTTGGTTGSTGGTTGGTGGTGGTTGGTTGSTGGTTGTNGFGAFSQIGTIATDGNGSFTFSQTTISGSNVNRARGGGSYTVGADCSIKLSFASNFPGTTPNFQPPVSVSGLTTDATGGVLVQQPNATTSPLTGTFIVQ